MTTQRTPCLAFSHINQPGSSCPQATFRLHPCSRNRSANHRSSQAATSRKACWSNAMLYGRCLTQYHIPIQVQHQLMVSGAALAHLWVFDGTQGLLLPIERNEAAMDRIKAGWDVFQTFMDSDTPPPLTDADTVQRSDLAWTAAAQAFAEAKRATDAADATLAKARDELVALAQHPREQGSGVSVTRYWKAGNVAYAKIPALKDVDLALYRGKAREEVRVTAA